MPGTNTLDGELMTFRTTWLRAVALAWTNGTFRSALVRDPKTALSDSFGFAWPWPNVLDFEVAEQPHFKWIGDDWTWPADGEDQLSLRIPLEPMTNGGSGAPVRIAASNHALALADYYAIRPSMFGTIGGGGATPRGNSLVTSAAIDLTERASLSLGDYMVAGSPVRFGGHGPPPGGFVPSAGSFMDFEVVVIAAMAKAWENAAFAQLLDADFNLALTTIRDYTEPWKLILKVKNDPTARWSAATVGQGGKVVPSKWETLSAHKLTLNLPCEPVIKDQSVALAAYNSTGAQFPFTCCA